MGAESIRVMCPLFQGEEGGSTPTSALQLQLYRIDFALARDLNACWHSRMPRIGDPERLMKASICFGAEFDGLIYAVAIWSHPVNRSLPQTTWLELRRLAIAPDSPRNTASRMLRIMTLLIRRERPELERLISYQDTDVHTGGIYAAAGWEKTAFSKWNTWNKPNSRNQNGRPRTRPESQSKANKQRWDKVLHEHDGE